MAKTQDQQTRTMRSVELEVAAMDSSLRSLRHCIAVHHTAPSDPIPPHPSPNRTPHALRYMHARARMPPLA